MADDNPSSQDGSAIWKFALIGGIASLPFTTLSYWQTGSRLSLAPVFFGGILAGYVAARNLGVTSDVGTRAGIVGSLPVVWVAFDVVNASSGLAGPDWFVAGGTVLAIGFGLMVIILGSGLAALIGELGAKVGIWIARKTTAGRRTDTTHA